MRTHTFEITLADELSRGCQHAVEYGQDDAQASLQGRNERLDQVSGKTW